MEQFIYIIFIGTEKGNVYILLLYLHFQLSEFNEKYLLIVKINYYL